MYASAHEERRLLQGKSISMGRVSKRKDNTERKSYEANRIPLCYVREAACKSAYNVSPSVNTA
jgi:hypothetical protein